MVLAAGLLATTRAAGELMEVSNAVPAASATGDSSENRSTTLVDAPQSSSALRAEYTQLTGLIIVPMVSTSSPLLAASNRSERALKRYQ